MRFNVFSGLAMCLLQGITSYTWYEAVYFSSQLKLLHAMNANFFKRQRIIMFIIMTESWTVVGNLHAQVPTQMF